MCDPRCAGVLESHSLWVAPSRFVCAGVMLVFPSALDGMRGETSTGLGYCFTGVARLLAGGSVALDAMRWLIRLPLGGLSLRVGVFLDRVVSSEVHSFTVSLSGQVHENRDESPRSTCGQAMLYVLQ